MITTRLADALRSATSIVLIGGMASLSGCFADPLPAADVSGCPQGPADVAYSTTAMPALGGWALLLLGMALGVFATIQVLSRLQGRPAD